MSRPAIALINSDHLRHNYRLLQRLAQHSEIMAVVKANAYGHELYLVANTLLEEGCKSFAVTDANEGSELRAILMTRNQDIEITLLSGIFDSEDAKLCLDAQLTPAITAQYQIELLAKAGFTGDIWLKLDTGMNRLGAIRPDEIFTSAQRAGLNIRGFMSHLACADEPNHPLNRAQADCFLETCNLLSPDTPKSLLNSAGLLTLPDCTFDVIRPGIALYGAEPVAESPLGLKPVMSLHAELMQIRDIPAGASVSYGASFTTAKPLQIGVVSLGYADGVPRELSNRGHVFLHGKHAAIIGRVCMDYTMIDVTDTKVQQGDSVEFWGENILANDIAESIDTISYTLFTGVGERVRRKTV